ncbi:LOW QUALITY PROTEIN: hypothetical protein IFM46972_06442 [Aspergillus udagawae]|uniref:Uncharacterized protein n=1 Tax=Aspergillus udagawae TaxID=91492 RepID=A0A8H3NVU4_9EURO|nr:LOW QUALITY PROTEIN: hypothetical protein IFM46972_06442 [Aspergillus udagawae]
MTDNHTPRPHHTQHMRRIHPRIRNLGIMRVHTPQRNPQPQSPNQPPHPLTEEPRPRPKPPNCRLIDPSPRIHIMNPRLHLRNLDREHVVPQRARRLVPHSMVPQLVARAHQVREHSLAPVHLRANHKERRGRARCCYLLCILRGGIVDGQCDELLVRGKGDVEEDVRVAVLEVADEEAWRFVDQIQG